MSQTEQPYSLQAIDCACTQILWSTTKQPYAALVCRLIVTLHFYVITCITTHVPIPGDGGWVGFIGWSIVDTLPTKWSRQPIDQAKIRESPPAKDRRPATKKLLKKHNLALRTSMPKNYARSRRKWCISTLKQSINRSDKNDKKLTQIMEKNKITACSPKVRCSTVTRLKKLWVSWQHWPWTRRADHHDKSKAPRHQT